MAAVSDLVVATGEMKSGRLFIRNRRAFDLSVSQLKEGVDLEITIKRLRATRSQQQNRYYWGIVVHLLSEHTGYTPDEMHDCLKAKFIPKQMSVCDGNGVIVDEFVLGGSTREMTTIEFGEYMEAIREWAAETLDVVIPDPDSDVPMAHNRADVASKSKWYRAKRRMEAVSGSEL